MSIDQRKAIELYNLARKTPRTKPTETAFRNEVVRFLFPGQEPDEENLIKIAPVIKMVFKRITRYCSAKNRRTASEDTFSMEEICISPEDYLCEDSDPKPKKARIKGPLEDVTSQRHRYRRLQPLIDMIKDVAAEEQTSEYYLLGVCLHQLYYKTNKKIAELANNLLTLEDSRKVTVETASNIKCYNNLGREGYQREVRALKTSGLDVLPSLKRVRDFEQSVTPTVRELANKQGVEFGYKEAVELSTKRIFQALANKEIPHEDLTLEDGLDGSGSHSVFNQKG